jgi:hypothetical protein
MAGFYLTIYNSAGRVDTTRPRHPDGYAFKFVICWISSNIVKNRFTKHNNVLTRKNTPMFEYIKNNETSRRLLAEKLLYFRKALYLHTYMLSESFVSTYIHAFGKLFNYILSESFVSSYILSESFVSTYFGIALYLHTFGKALYLHIYFWEALYPHTYFRKAFYKAAFLSQAQISYFSLKLLRRRRILPFHCCHILSQIETDDLKVWSLKKEQFAVRSFCFKITGQKLLLARHTLQVEI